MAEATASPYRDLAKRFFITLLLGVLVYRFGSYVTIPGVDALALQARISGSEGISSVLQWANMFNGGSLARASLFGLGIMPYISASIIFQLLAASYPSLKQLQREGESGRRKLNQYTRYATLVICLIQASMASSALLNMGEPGQPGIVAAGYAANPLIFVALSTLVITTGSMILLWIAEQITKYGVGNGTSVIIMVGILAGFPEAMGNYFSSAGSSSELPGFLLIMAIFIGVVAAMVVLTLARRMIPLEQQRRIQGNKVYGGAQTQLPLMLNQAGVTPVIFSSPVMILLAMLAGLAGLPQFFAIGEPMYRLAYLLLIIGFAYFYLSIAFDINDIANHFKQAGFFIRGVRPGQKTVEYIRWRVVRVAFVGSMALGLVAVSPELLNLYLKIDGRIAHQILSGVSLLIVVGVAIDIIQKVSSYLLSHQYQGMMSGATATVGANRNNRKRF